MTTASPRLPIVNRRVTPADVREKRTIGFGVRPDEAKIKLASAGLGALKDGKQLPQGLGALDSSKPAVPQIVRRGLGDLVDAVRNSVACPIWNMPVVESSRGTFGGPLLDADVGRLFGATINPFGWNDGTEGLDYLDTTLAQNGETQTPMLVCAVGWKLQPDPIHLSARVNAWTAPITGVAQPPSPNNFTSNDITNNAILTAAQITAGQVFEPGVLEWGVPFAYAFWHMARAYHLRWKVGHHTNIFDDSLRNTAYVPPGVQEGTGSSSELDINVLVRRINDRYTTLGSALVALKIDSIRLGSRTVAGANVGVFTPSRSEELVGVTYGGIDLRSMINNTSEFRKLAVPYFLNAGIPIGLFAQESDTFQGAIMREYLSITNGLGGANVPPNILDAANINAGFTTPAAGNIANELTLDAAPVMVPQSYPVNRRLFKGGDWKVEADIKGFEVDEDWYNTLKNNAELRDAFMCECGCSWPK